MCVYSVIHRYISSDGLLITQHWQINAIDVNIWICLSSIQLFMQPALISSAHTSDPSTPSTITASRGAILGNCVLLFLHGLGRVGGGCFFNWFGLSCCFVLHGFWARADRKGSQYSDIVSSDVSDTGDTEGYNREEDKGLTIVKITFTDMFSVELLCRWWYKEDNDPGQLIPWPGNPMADVLGPVPSYTGWEAWGCVWWLLAVFRKSG